MSADVSFTDGNQVSAKKDSIGKDLNAMGPGSLSAGGPVETPTDYDGRSCQFASPSNAVPQGGEISSPVDE